MICEDNLESAFSNDAVELESPCDGLVSNHGRSVMCVLVLTFQSHDMLALLMAQQRGNQGADMKPTVTGKS